MSENTPINDSTFCSFCGKHQREVHGLVSGPAVFICTDCVRGAIELIAGQMRCRPEMVYTLLTLKVHSIDDLVEIATARADSPVEITSPRPPE